MLSPFFAEIGFGNSDLHILPEIGKLVVRKM